MALSSLSVTDDGPIPTPMASPVSPFPFASSFSLQRLIAFWEEAQRDPDAAIAAQPDDASLDEGTAPRKRRRRRRRSHAAGE